jgi:hypothetical protein
VRIAEEMESFMTDSGRDGKLYDSRRVVHSRIEELAASAVAVGLCYRGSEIRILPGGGWSSSPATLAEGMSVTEF